jgi:radical SAM superfamily enzyme YgiQ (UPF0313 family)
MSWQQRRRLKQWLAEETGTVVKDWGGKVPIALAYPNRYFVGMSNLGFQTVYHLLNQQTHIVCERVFLPEPGDLAAAGAGPGPLSVESQRPLRDFRLIAFSVAFENDYVNLVHLLRLGKVTLYSSHRQRHEPLVVAGGIATFLNPEPLAPFVDLFLLGEAETLLREFVTLWEEGYAAAYSREDLLCHIAERVSGAYVPSLYRPEYHSDGTLSTFEPLTSIARSVSLRFAALEREQPATTRISTPHTEFANTVLLEIGRGCAGGCRFCAAGFVYRPVRYHPGEALVRPFTEGAWAGGKIGLLSAAVSDHPDIDNICLQLRRAGARLTVSSLRADSLTPGMLGALCDSGLQTVAIAPEAGSERLRRVSNKNLSEEQILEAVAAVAAAGIPNLRLYFMIGLPTETETDVDAIVHLVKRIKHQQLTAARARGRLGTLTLSVNSFVPKPSTPFQWVPFSELALLKRRLKKLKRALGSVANVRVHADVPRWAYIEALLCRGDRRLAPLIAAVVDNGGNWPKALKSINVNPDFYVSRERRWEELFPWDFIEHGVSKDYLWQEYQRALAGETTPPCDPEHCTRCGACTPHSA